MTIKPIITLTTDFGLSDGYVGMMEGVILGICPEATITHLTHAIPPQNVEVGAFVLYQSFSYFPKHTVHCVVVDPGVGSRRQAVAFRTDQGIFVGPDNGIFDLVLDAAHLQEAVSLTNPKYQLPHVCANFHGRDIFAPAAAHLAAGVSLRSLGEPVTALVKLDSRPELEAGQARIIHVDHFGNLVLDITAHDFDRPETIVFDLGGSTIKSISQTFTDVAEGEPVAYPGSCRDHIEIAIRNGNAAKTFDLRRGDVVQFFTGERKVEG